MPKLTISIAVYNAEKYLDVCLNSVINQSVKDLEILCVEDCSTDNSLDILERYALFDSRIKIIKQSKNSGLSAARNVAIQNASSPYIMFVDADDFISPFMAEVLLNNITTHQSDFVYGNCQIFDNKTMNTRDWRLISDTDFKKIVVADVFNAQSAPAFLPFYMHVMTWSKLFKTDFIKDISFLPIPISEDEPFFFECFLKATRISYELNSLYYYRFNRQGSLISSNDKLLFSFEAQHQNQKVFEKFGVFEKYKEHFLLHKFSRLIYRTSQTTGTIKQKMFEMLKNEIKTTDLTSYNLDILRKHPVFFQMQNISNMNFDDFDVLYQGGF